MASHIEGEPARNPASEFWEVCRMKKLTVFLGFLLFPGMTFGQSPEQGSIQPVTSQNASALSIPPSTAFLPATTRSRQPPIPTVEWIPERSQSGSPRVSDRSVPRKAVESSFPRATNFRPVGVKAASGHAQTSSGDAAVLGNGFDMPPECPPSPTRFPGVNRIRETHSVEPITRRAFPYGDFGAQSYRPFSRQTGTLHRTKTWQW